MLRKLVACSIACACVYSSLFANNPPEWADGPVQQSYLKSELARLQHELALTPDQVTRVRAAMEAVVHGTATKTVEQTLHEVCTPAQFAAWWQTKLAFERTDAARRASAAADEIEKTILLSAKQRGEVEAAFTQIELADRTYLVNAHTKAELQTHFDQMAAAREFALEKILTPRQIERRTELAQADFSKPLPDLPTLSPTLNLQPNRYGWSSESAAP